MQREKTDDAFGTALASCFDGKGGSKAEHYVIEREDGFLDVGSLRQYFTEFEGWSEIERKMPEFARGAVLDVGCGAGRHCLHLQKLGFRAVGIDSSPLAVAVARKRGVVHALAVSVDDLAESGLEEYAPFGTVVMMGHNIGLLHGERAAQGILERLHRLTAPDARIVGTTRDPYLTGDGDHLRYQEWNLERGRMRGQIRFRIRYRKLTGPWLDYLIVSEAELDRLARSAGWRLETAFHGEGEFGGPSYLAVLAKQ